LRRHALGSACAGVILVDKTPGAKGNCAGVILVDKERKINSKQLAQRIAWVAKFKKAEQVIILDVSQVAGFCDYFVIASGNSLRQVTAIAQAISEDLEIQKIKSLPKVSPNEASGWIALDYSSVIAHAFYKPLREFYALEKLWSDAKRVRVVTPKK